MVLDTECFEKVSIFMSAKGLEKIGMFRYEMHSVDFLAIRIR